MENLIDSPPFHSTNSCVHLFVYFVICLSLHNLKQNTKKALSLFSSFKPMLKFIHFLFQFHLMIHFLNIFFFILSFFLVIKTTLLFPLQIPFTFTALIFVTTERKKIIILRVERKCGNTMVRYRICLVVKISIVASVLVSIRLTLVLIWKNDGKRHALFKFIVPCSCVVLLTFGIVFIFQLVWTSIFSLFIYKYV